MPPIPSANSLRLLSLPLRPRCGTLTNPLPSRPFTFSSVRCTKTLTATRIPDSFIPPYPYGPRLHYKQSNQGLYGLSRIRFGNIVSGRNKIKTKRNWKPNVHRKKLWSESLGAWVKIRLSMRVLRTMKKEGGLDEYLLGSKATRIKELGPGGWKLRWLIMQTESVRVRFEKQREALGLTGEAPSLGAVESAELLQIAVDSATPGNLSRTTRDILAARARAVAEEEEFGLGEESSVGEGQLETQDEYVEEVITRELGAREPNTEDKEASGR